MAPAAVAHELLDVEDDDQRTNRIGELVAVLVAAAVADLLLSQGVCCSELTAPQPITRGLTLAWQVHQRLTSADEQPMR